MENWIINDSSVCFLFFSHMWSSLGPDRNVIFCELSALEKWLASSNSCPPPDFTAVDSAVASTVLAMERNTDGYYLCVAMTESVVLYKYNPSLKTFIIRKVCHNKSYYYLSQFFRNTSSNAVQDCDFMAVANYFTTFVLG